MIHCVKTLVSIHEYFKFCPHNSKVVSNKEEFKDKVYALLFVFVKPNDIMTNKQIDITNSRITFVTKPLKSQ